MYPIPAAEQAGFTPLAGTLEAGALGLAQTPQNLLPQQLWQANQQREAFRNPALSVPNYRDALMQAMQGMRG